MKKLIAYIFLYIKSYFFSFTKNIYFTYGMFLCAATSLALFANGQYFMLNIRSLPGVAGGKASAEKNP